MFCPRTTVIPPTSNAPRTPDRLESVPRKTGRVFTEPALGPVEDPERGAFDDLPLPLIDSD